MFIKDYLSFFYGIKYCDIFEDYDSFLIVTDSNRFRLHFVHNVDDIVYLYNNTNDKYDRIVLNNYGEVISFFNNNYFVLVCLNNHDSDDLAFIPIILGHMKEAYWLDKWRERYFYYENISSTLYSISEIIYESIDYYLGLFYLVIDYYSKVDSCVGKASFVHRYFNKKDYYDPCILKVDVIEREFSEYIKYLFFIEKKDFLYIKNLIDENINSYNKELLFSRLVYPNYYFDVLDEILLEKKDPSELKDIVMMHDEYERFLEYVVNHYLIV